jgi:hypothetical protein
MRSPTRVIRNWRGLLIGGPGLVKYILNFETPLKLANSKRKPSLTSKIFKLCMQLDLNNFEQLSPLGRLQILNRIHVLNSGTQLIMNLP